MKAQAMNPVRTGVVAFSVLVAMPAFAANDNMPMDKATGGRDAQEMGNMTHDMSIEMRELADQLSTGRLDAAAQKRMVKGMRDMPAMMNNMSEMIARGTPMDGDHRKQIGQMRRQMDKMMKQTHEANPKM